LLLIVIYLLLEIIGIEIIWRNKLCSARMNKTIIGDDMRIKQKAVFGNLGGLLKNLRVFCWFFRWNWRFSKSKTWTPFRKL